jgi:nucleoside-diphosphate-sugar epimerase
MKVLLTGASGFVGSHILDQLRAQAIPLAVLLRPASERKFIEAHGTSSEIRLGSINDPATLSPALSGITHIIHCAGLTKARRVAEFYEVNQVGTRNLVAAANAQPAIQRVVHISSLAAAGPATPAKPVREADPPHPVSEYGRSKLAAEAEVRERCRPEFVILRPPAVYGPRDEGFLEMFRAVKRHLLPCPGGRQSLSLVYVRDLAAAAVACLRHPAAPGKTFFAAHPAAATAREMAGEIARQMSVWTVPIPLPVPFLWTMCLLQETASRVSGQARLLNLAKFPELAAPGWVCDSGLMERELGVRCDTQLKEGVAETLAWYRENGWL